MVTSVGTHQAKAMDGAEPNIPPVSPSVITDRAVHSPTYPASIKASSPSHALPTSPSELIPRIMSTPLLQQFPSLSAYPAAFLKDLLSSPELTEAFLFTLPEVQQLAAEVEKLGKENEDLASESPRSPSVPVAILGHRSDAPSSDAH